MIYTSTGGFRDQPAWLTSQKLIERGISNIELSGGTFDPNTLSQLKKLSTDANFQIHNYFPSPEVPFVFNLASLNQHTAQRSIDHARVAMQWAVELGNPIYSFHAGFLLDPKVEELGGGITKRPMFNREHAMEVFLERVNMLADEAKQMGVSLLIENNVISANNLKIFTENPFLMATSEECVHVMNHTPSNVQLLIDVAHLKVSAHSLGFDKVTFLNECFPWIGAHHLSDNDGKRDSNQIVTRDSWFWPYLKQGLSYYSLEIYNIPLEKMLQQLTISEENLCSS
jgi:sugar phosphate isomerase/epimerase